MRSKSGFSNIVHFYEEANNYIFYENVYVAAYMDKDVETDIVPYPQYGNQEIIRCYRENSQYLHFLPYTPEVLLIKMLYENKPDLLRKLASEYEISNCNIIFRNSLILLCMKLNFPISTRKKNISNLLHGEEHLDHYANKKRSVS